MNIRKCIDCGHCYLGKHYKCIRCGGNTYVPAKVPTEYVLRAIFKAILFALVAIGLLVMYK